MTGQSPVLAELRARLERLGWVVVPHGDHLCVRLALFTSVRVRIRDGRLMLSPQFGPMGRTGGLLATSATATGVVAASAVAAGAAPVTLVAAFLGVVALAHDACRFVVTEGALTRLQLLAADAGVAPADDGVALRDPSSRQQLLGVGSPLAPGPGVDARSVARGGDPSPRPPSRRTLP